MDLIDRLAEHRALQGAPREELAWLAANGALRTLEPGEFMSRKGEIAPSMSVIFSGAIALFIDRGAGPDKVVEWHGGDITGVLPYSRLVSPPGDVITLEHAELFALPREKMPALIRECTSITGILVHIMLDRARLFTSSELHNEKMISLGKLSAGLAHELNNPAAAIERCASQLEDRLDDLESATRAMSHAHLTKAQFTAIDAIRAACLTIPAQPALSPLEQADREDEIAAWLLHHRLDPDLAAMLADTSVTLAALDQLSEAIPEGGPALNAVLRWTAASCSARNLAGQVQDSAMRISSLVTAVKGFTHMDQAMVAESEDLKLSLDNTVAVLNAKARTRSVAVTVDLPGDLPHVRGYAAELSQIWGNLIDNALDAVDAGGRVDVLANCDSSRVAVRIIDNGPGIPKALLARIFDPFFTTKPMGQGTGLGLDIVRRLVRHNNGSIEVDSRPGRTEFRVWLPIA